MAIEDDISCRVQRAAGDSVPVNTITGTGFTGGTQSGVDQGGEDAWRFQGPGIATTPAAAPYSWTNNGPGHSLAVRCIVTNNGSNFDDIVSTVDTATSNDPKLRFTNNGANNSRFRFEDNTAQTIGIDTRVEVRTYVLTANLIVGTDTMNLWLDGGVGDAPDIAGPGFNVAASEFNAFAVSTDATGSYDITILDYVVWNRVLTDAEARAVANDIRGQLPVGGAPTTTTATVTISGGADLTGLSYTVYAGYDVGVSSILQQGNGETTDSGGVLEIDLAGSGALNGDPVTIVVTDYTTTPSALSSGAVCYTTVVVA